MARIATPIADIDQRIDEIAEARLEHLVLLDRPHEDEPVGREQHGRDDHAAQRLRIAQRRCHLRHAIAQQQDSAHDEQRRDSAVGHDGDRTHILQGVEQQGQEAPEQVADKADDQAGLRIARRCLVVDGGFGNGQDIYAAAGATVLNAALLASPYGGAPIILFDLDAHEL
ncbi:MAG: hypothetical protein J0I48_06425 [Devosia sp.]|nr:hypothetical protein [Devosia sp.]